MHRPLPLEVVAWGPADPLATVGDSRQVRYLRRSLDDLGAVSVLVEPYYFDRDYLAEFSAFYCTSSAGYANVCRRLHFFKSEITREHLTRALADDPEAVALLSSSYLGFVVLRPIPASADAAAHRTENSPAGPFRKRSPSQSICALLIRSGVAMPRRFYSIGRTQVAVTHGAVTDPWQNRALAGTVEPGH